MQLLRSPFFGNLISYPSFQSGGTSSTSQIFSKRGYNIFNYTVVFVSALGALQGIPWGSAALPLCSCLIVILISSLVSVPLSISRSSAAGKMSDGFCGAGSKCSTHLLPLLFLPHNLSSCVILHWSFWIPELSRSFLVVSYRPFISPLLLLLAQLLQLVHLCIFFYPALMPFENK